MEAILEPKAEIPNIDVPNFPKVDKKRRHKKSQRFPEDMNGYRSEGKLVLPTINPYKRRKADRDLQSDSDGKSPRRMLPDWQADRDVSKPSPRQRQFYGSGSDISAKGSEVSWVTFGSPLWQKDTVQGRVKPLPPLWKQREMEKGFVNDGVKTYMHFYSRRKPIIPPYNAIKDKYAQAYFQSPLVKAVLDRSMEKALALKHRADQNDISAINKLSFHRRCKTSPTVEQIRAREQQFVNDAITTDKLRTKYRDIIPRYDASLDKNCKKYFCRPDVQRLLSSTCSQK